MIKTESLVNIAVIGIAAFLLLTATPVQNSQVCKPGARFAS